ncbi:unnamed protein product [Adineta steineri]|uniref:Uncharacterized protein n=1 Tax=Adineta steineri TaxID=433720 RepID=A0A818UXS2_9BILA|nr:unnamed protein product [Adineta steineri]
MKTSHRKDKSIAYIDFNQNSIIKLLRGPDTQYKHILNDDNQKLNVPLIREQCQDKNSFLQIHVRPLSAKKQKQLLRKQYRQLTKRRCQSIKNKCLRFKFPVTYPCPVKYKRRNSRSIPSNSSMKQSLSNNINRLKSAVSISFIDDMSIYKNSKQNYSSSLLNIPSKNNTTDKIRSSNACIEKHLCQLCGSLLSNGICTCIVQYLIQLNNTRDKDILV